MTVTKTIHTTFDACDGRTFANVREYADAIATGLGDAYDALSIADICGGWDFDRTGRPTFAQRASLECFATICADYGPIDAGNFFTSTRADFVSVHGHATRPADFVSDSGSRYWYSDEGVYRESDHWGRGVASCDWYLDGGEYGWTAETVPACGFCAWGDFAHK